MKIRLILIGILLVSAICEMKSQITASEESGCAPLVGVEFSSPNNASDINWNFGDNTSSNLSNPVHTFINPGIYQIEYTSVVNGASQNESLTITVFSNPSLNFETNDPTIACEGTPIQFTTEASGGGGASITNYSWSFGDGGTQDGILPNPSYEYTVAGTFDVGLTVTDSNGCDSTLVLNEYIKINAAPEPIISQDPASTAWCEAPVNIDFDGSNSISNSLSGQNLTYHWDFGDGTISVLEDPPTHTFNQNGSYLVVLTVTDDIGCSANENRLINITDPIADFYIEGAISDTICQKVDFVNTSTNGDYFWDYGDGTTYEKKDTLHTFPGPGTYPVTLTVSTNGCESSKTIIYTILDMIPDFVTEPSYSCEIPFEINFTDQSVNAAQWFWQFSNGDTSTLQNPSVIINSKSDNPYTIYQGQNTLLSHFLTIISPHGCVKDSLHYATDTLFFPTGRILPDVSQGCVPLTVNFSDQSISKEDITFWEYHFGDGEIETYNASAGAVTHIYNETGVFDAFLIIENEKGCRDTSYIQPIKVGDLLNPEIVLSETVVCPNQAFEITEINGDIEGADTWAFELDGNNFKSCPGGLESIPSLEFSNVSGLQNITINVGFNGCINPVVAEGIIEVSGPMAFLSHECNCVTPLEYTFNADVREADFWTWDFGDGISADSVALTNMTHTYETSGDYWVTLTSFMEETSCQPFIDSLLIKVRNVQAEFEAPERVCVGAFVEFESASSSDVFENCHYGYEWYFDDDPSDGPLNIGTSIYEYAFETSGLHNVRLVATDYNGCRDTVFHQVQSYKVESELETDTTIGCLFPGPLEINFSDLSTADTTITSWSWDFGDLNSSTVQNPTYGYTTEPDSTDFYCVVLTATDILGCADSSIVKIFPQIPDANFFANSDRTVCLGDMVGFTPQFQNYENYSWDFGDGMFSDELKPDHPFNESGNFPVQLTVTDSSGCQHTVGKDEFVKIQSYPEAAFISDADDLEHKCYPLLVNYQDQSSSEFEYERDWDLGNSSTIVDESEVGTLYELPGTYDLNLIVSTSFGCKDTASNVIEIEGPVGDFELNPQQICKGDEITFSIIDTNDVAVWSWDFGDGTNAGSVSPVEHDYEIDPGSGQTFVSLVYWSPDSACSASTVKPIEFVNVIADFDRNNEMALEDSVHCLGIADFFFNNSVNGNTFEWDFGNGQTSNEESPSLFTYEASGSYEVKLSITNDATGCEDFIIKQMEILANPDLSVIIGSACEGDSLALNAFGGFNYQWSPAEIVNEPTSNYTYATPDSTTLFTLTGETEFGCKDSIQDLGIVYQEPPSIVLDTSIIVGEQIQLNIFEGEGVTYNWSPSEGLSCADCSNPIITTLESIDYELEISDPLGCFNAKSYYNIEIKPLTSVDVPTAFTPNGDGINDLIFVDGWGIRELIEFKIYNRYGQVVFVSNDINEGWDGYFEGKLQNTETYTYTVLVETWLDETLNKTGTLNLLK